MILPSVGVLCYIGFHLSCSIWLIPRLKVIPLLLSFTFSSSLRQQELCKRWSQSHFLQMRKPDALINIYKSCFITHHKPCLHGQVLLIRGQLWTSNPICRANTLTQPRNKKGHEHVHSFSIQEAALMTLHLAVQSDCERTTSLWNPDQQGAYMNHFYSAGVINPLTTRFYLSV